MIPPAVTATDPQSGFGALVDHLGAAATFTLPLLLDAVTGGDSAYDGKFYRDRSPSRVINRVQVPTFLVGGEFDIFQRGTPLLFENLQRRGVPTKMIIGPWDHLEGSSGADVGKAGHGTSRRAAAAVVRPLRARRRGPDARHGHPADHLLRAGQRPVDQGAALDRATSTPRRTASPARRPPAAATAC